MEPARRNALFSLTGAAVAGAGLLISACAHGGEDGDKVTANEDLMREHGILRRILITYRELAPRLIADPAAIDVAALADAARLFRAFGEHYHEQLLEERHVFPIIRKAGDEAGTLIDTLIAQHARGREITAYILDRTHSGRVATGDVESLARSLAAFARMYEPHAAREDTIVFPAFKAAVGKTDYDALGEDFEEIEKREFGGDGFDRAIAKVADIERRLGTADLGAFTAPAIGAGSAA
jgi:hemerythrin-like domain-containing protein